MVAEIEAAGGKAAFIHTDVSQERQAEAMVELAVDTFGRLGGAINNAGHRPRCEVPSRGFHCRI